MNLSNQILPPASNRRRTVALVVFAACVVLSLVLFISRSIRHAPVRIEQAKSDYVNFVQTLPVQEPSQSQITNFASEHSLTTLSDEQKADFLKTN